MCLTKVNSSEQTDLLYLRVRHKSLWLISDPFPVDATSIAIERLNWTDSPWKRVDKQSNKMLYSLSKIFFFENYDYLLSFWVVVFVRGRKIAQ